MEFLQGTDAAAFVLTAALAGGFAATGLARDGFARVAAGGGREAILAPLGLAALAAAYASGAGRSLRLLAGALLLTGLALLALTARRDRTSPGRQIGVFLGWLAVTIALLGAFLPDPSAPDSPV